MGTTHTAKRPFKFENVWLEVDGFVILLKMYGMISMFLVLLVLSGKQLNFPKSKLKEWNREVFGHLDTKLGALVDKVKVWDAKKQLQSLSHGERIERLEVKKDLSLVRNWIDIFWRQTTQQHWIHKGDRNTNFFFFTEWPIKEQNSTQFIAFMWKVHVLVTLLW